MIRGADGELELSVGRTMTVLNELGFLLAGWLHRHGHGPITPMLERLYARPRRVRSLTAACLLVRREALESVAGLDETFFLYAEDVDLCRRLRAAGWRLRYVPGARAQHLRGASGQVDPGATAAAYRRSQLAFYRKHHGRLQRALLRIWLLGRYGTALLISRGKRRDRYRRLLALVRDTDRHRDA